MPEISDFAAANGLSAESLVGIAEAQVVNPESALYKHIVEKAAEKFAAMFQASEVDSPKKKGDRVYLPYYLGPTEKYRLSAAFPQFDLYYTSPIRASAAYARSVSLLVSEYLLGFVPKAEKGVVAYGYSLVPTMMRNRTWLYPCYSGADPEVQLSLMDQDRSLSIIYTSYGAKTRRPPQLLESYMTQSVDHICTQAHDCTHKSSYAVMMLDQVDTNFRQIAVWMHRHETRICHVAIPSCKAMEVGFDAPFPELQAHVVYDDGRVYVVYHDDGSWQQCYSHANYLEVIARQRVVMFGKTFFKEYVNTVAGYRHYKISVSDGEHLDPIPPYKSWIEPGYRNKYILRVPRLGDGGKVWRPGDWSWQAECDYVPVSKAPFDSVMALALSADDKKIDDVIARRIFSIAFNYIVEDRMVHENALTVQQFLDMLHVVYVESFMRKFQSGTTVSALAPVARRPGQASRMGSLRSLSASLFGATKEVVGTVTGFVTSPVRRAHDYMEGTGDVPLPVCLPAPGFVEYDDGGGGNPRFAGWDKGESPFDGFCPGLPGGPPVPGMRMKQVISEDVLSLVDEPTLMERFANVTRSCRDVVGTLQETLLSSVDSDDENFGEAAFAGVAGEFEQPWDDVNRAAQDIPSTSRCSSVTSEELIDMLGGVIEPEGTYNNSRFPLLGTRVISAGEDPQDFEEYAEAVVRRMEGDVEFLRDRPTPFVYNAYLVPDRAMHFTPGDVSLQPLEDFRNALSGLFPESMMIDTSNVESLRLHTDRNLSLKAIFMKIDISKLDEPKPERFYPPLLKGHLLPDVKENTVTVLSTLAKRNADTPYGVDPQDAVDLWRRVEEACYKVYYVSGARQWLEAQPRIHLTEENLREWLHKQPPAKKQKLVDPDRGYNAAEMMLNTRSLQLMLKGKLKPEMDASYATALKLPQSIQFDQTGKSVAAFSPVIRTKVKREAYILKPNVLVLQRKSYRDLFNFVNCFDSRTDARGPRRYIEIDETLFDKAQTAELREFYRKRLLQFGVSDEIVGFIENCMNERSVSSVKAGVKMKLVDQNPSGSPYTLDRNNDVSMMIMALLLAEIPSERIEFVICMGDDMTIAVRGDVDTTHWERFLNRFFNMSAKVSFQEYGNICSYDLIHRSDGSTIPIRDLVKAMIGFMKRSMKQEEKFEEMYISFCDSMPYVDDLETQIAGSRQLVQRWRKILPWAEAQHFHTLFKAHTAMKRSKASFRAMYGAISELRFY